MSDSCLLETWIRPMGPLTPMKLESFPSSEKDRAWERLRE